MKTKADDHVEEGDESGKEIDGKKEEKIAENVECMIDIEEGEDGDGRSRKMANSKVEKVCRICHFSKEPLSNKLGLISLGCDCKGELGSSHKHCAEAWFGQKGDRICEICGKNAKNVNNNTEDTSVFMMELNEMRMVAASLDYSHESSRRCKRFLCNFLLACLLLLFLLLWLFRGTHIV